MLFNYLCAMTFEELQLAPGLLQALEEAGYTEPSPIQESAIPTILEGKDLLAAAQTGTGKTAAFVLPILQKLKPSSPNTEGRVKALILAPTRELVQQIEESVIKYSKHLDLRVASAFGGVDIRHQIEATKHGVDILVATPGRLLDLHTQKKISFTGLKFIVLDEADRMLALGFYSVIKEIISYLPTWRQSLLFSATFNPKITELAKDSLKNPVIYEVPIEDTAAATVEQEVYEIDQGNKTNLLIHIFGKKKWRQLIVFCKTKHGANRLAKALNFNNITAVAIHSDRTQQARTQALKEFKAGEIKVMVATDIAARGLDIKALPAVINFDMPQVVEDYVHRIGRTGRAGASGHAISFVCPDENSILQEVEELIAKRIPVRKVKGFNHDLQVLQKSKSKQKASDNAPKKKGERPTKRDRREEAAKKKHANRKVESKMMTAAPLERIEQERSVKSMSQAQREKYKDTQETNERRGTRVKETATARMKREKGPKNKNKPVKRKITKRK